MSLTPRNQMFRIIGRLYGAPWAITSAALDFLIETFETPVDLDALATRIGRPLENTGHRISMRNGVAVMDVTGPIFRHADIFTEISGATSVEHLATDFQTALDDPQVRAILLNVNSPGGEIDGIQEFADQVRAGTSKKPVTAYVDGMAASAAYWIASAAERIVAAETAVLGSIGVVASLRDNRAAQERQGVKTHEIVSSKSPFKRPDPATDEGRAQVLELVDSLADVFIGKVATFRGVTAAKVESDFGQGKIVIASRAVQAGMADSISGFEPLVARLAADSSRAISISANQEVIRMSPSNTITTALPAAPTEDPPVTITPVTITTTSTGTIILDPAAAERARIAGILGAPEATGREILARTLAFDMQPTLSVESARAILAAAPTQAAPAVAAGDPLAARMAAIPNPTVGTREAGSNDTEEAEADRILGLLPKHMRVA